LAKVFKENISLYTKSLDEAHMANADEIFFYLSFSSTEPTFLPCFRPNHHLQPQGLSFNSRKPDIPSNIWSVHNDSCSGQATISVLS
jgi:hypothetical protein